MAMLQLSGVLSNTTVRITPRASWWITAQHLLSASSIAINPNPAPVDSIKDEKIENVENLEKPLQKQRNFQLRGKEGRSLITAAFENLLNDSRGANYEKTKELNRKIYSVTDLNELLNMVEEKNFNNHNASAVIYVLCNWITSGKIKMNEVQTDARYLKVCSVLGFTKKTTNPFVLNQSEESESSNSSLYGLLQTEKAKKQIAHLNIHETLAVLSTLAQKQKRTTPLLKELSSKIVKANKKLNIKQIGDILYSMAVLTYYDEVLIEKISKDLLEAVHTNSSSAVAGSILTSIGLLRYRNEPLLNALSTWIAKHQNIIRPQEISSFLLTLAYLDYTPTNFKEIFEHIIAPLRESEMCQSSEWLDIVWSLTILNQATSEQYESVLNSGFLNRLIDITELSTSKALKLLNVNAAARLLMPDYKGSLVPEDHSLFSTLIGRTKDKIAVSNAVISALKILLPSDPIYLNTNVNTQMGFILDAEFCVDSNCTPLPVNCKTEEDKKVFRIGVLTCSYNDFSRGMVEVIGPVKLYKKLLESQGYKILLIPYSKVNVRDKLVTRVKFINDNIKLLVQNNPKQ